MPVPLVFALALPVRMLRMELFLPLAERLPGLQAPILRLQRLVVAGYLPVLSAVRRGPFQLGADMRQEVGEELVRVRAAVAVAADLASSNHSPSPLSACLFAPPSTSKNRISEDLPGYCWI